MTSTGTFISNGAERVVVSQLVRSPGVYFTTDTDANTGRPLAAAKLIPYRGAWMEFETSNRDVISVKVDRKRKTPVSTLLRCLGYETNEEILSLFNDVDTDPEHAYISDHDRKGLRRVGQERRAAGVLSQASTWRTAECGQRQRPAGEPVLQPASVRPRQVGRYKLNRKLHPENEDDFSVHTLTREDIVELLRSMTQINNGVKGPDDIDHLGNRRVRAVGELIQNQVRVGLIRMERVIKERMTTQMDPANHNPGRADKHQAGRRLSARILRRLAVVAVHGPDEPAGRTNS